MEAIYLRYSRRESSFGNTLSLIQDLLSERLRSEFRRIWVHGSNSGRTRLCFTIFHDSGYTMRFYESGSIRQFRGDGNIEEESQLINSLISTLQRTVLSDYIN
jgi:hypothetical protein